jgi:hypothetical protein
MPMDGSLQQGMIGKGTLDFDRVKLGATAGLSSSALNSRVA